MVMLPAQGLGLQPVTDKEEARKLNLQRRLQQGTPQVFTAQDAQVLGLDISDVGIDNWRDWQVKFSPDATRSSGFFTSFINPEGFIFDEDSNVTTPDGQTFTQQDFARQGVQTPAQAGLVGQQEIESGETTPEGLTIRNETFANNRPEVEQALDQLRQLRDNPNQDQLVIINRYRSRNELLDMPGLTQEERIEVAFGGEEGLARALEQNAPSVESLDELRDIAVSDPDAIVDWAREQGNTTATRSLLWAAVPELTLEQVNQVFGLADISNAVDFMKSMTSTFTPQESSLEWVAENPMEFIQRVVESDDDFSDRVELIKTFFPELSNIEINNILHTDMGPDTRNWFGKFWGQLVAGTGDILTSVGGGLEWLGGPFENIGEAMSIPGKIAQTQGVTDGGLGFAAVRMLPTMAALIATSIASFGATGALLTAARVPAAAASIFGTGTLATRFGSYAMGMMQSLGASATATGMESFMEAGSLYQQLIDQGVPEDVAGAKATDVFTKNLAALGITNAPEFIVALAPWTGVGRALPSLLQRGIIRTGTKVAGVAGVALTEGGQEYYQQIIQMQAMGEDISAWAVVNNLSNDEIRQVTLLGMIAGGVFAGGVQVLSVFNNTFKANLPPELQTQVNKDIAASVRAGMPKAQAEVQAFNDIAELPEVQPILEGTAKVMEAQAYAEQIVAPDQATALEIENKLNQDIAATGLQNVEPISIRVVGITPETAQVIGGARAELGEGKYIDTKNIIARPIEDVGIKYGDVLPINVWLHGSKRTSGDIDNFSVSNKDYGTMYLTKNWDVAENYEHKGGGIKAVEVNPSAKILDISNAQDRQLIEDILVESTGDYTGIANELSDYNFDESGLSDNTEIGNALYEANIDAVKDTRGNIDIISDNAIKTYNPLIKPTAKQPWQKLTASRRAFEEAVPITDPSVTPERVVVETPPHQMVKADYDALYPKFEDMPATRQRQLYDEYVRQQTEFGVPEADIMDFNTFQDFSGDARFTGDNLDTVSDHQKIIKERYEQGHVVPDNVKADYPEMFKAIDARKQKATKARVAREKKVAQVTEEAIPEPTEEELAAVEAQAEIVATEEFLQNDPVAQYQGKMGKRTMSLTGLLKGTEWPETFTQKQAEVLLMGREIEPNVLTPEGRVRFEYIIDELHESFGMSEQEFIDHVINIKKTQIKLAEMKAEMAEQGAVTPETMAMPGVQEVQPETLLDEEGKPIPPSTVTYEQANKDIQDIVAYHRQERADIKGVKKQLTKYIRDTLPVSERGRLLIQVRDAENNTQLDKAIAMVNGVAEAHWRRTLKAKIKKETTGARAKVVKGFPQGRFTAETQELLDTITAGLKLSRAEAMAKVSENIAAVIEGKMDREVAYQANQLLDMAGVEGQSALELQNTYDNIRSIKATGRMLRQEKVEAERQRIEEVRLKSVDDITGGKGLKEGAVSARDLEQTKSFLDKLVNWQFGLDDLIDKLSKFTKAKPYQSFISQTVTRLVRTSRNAEQAGIAKATLKAREALKSIYGVQKTRELNKTLNDMNREHDLGTFKNGNGVMVEFKITRNQAIKKYQELLDPTLETTFKDTMGWTFEMTNAMLKILTQQDIEWANWQLDFYQEYYHSIDAIYSDLYGVHLPHNEFYSPINREVESSKPEHLLMVEDLFSYASVKNRSLKSRTKSNAPLKFIDANTTLVDHINQMEHFKAWAHSISDMRRVFNDDGVRTAIRQYHGPEILKLLDTFINDIARGGVERAKVNRTADKFRARFTKAILGLKPNIALKQIPSTMAYMTGMPVGDYFSGVRDFWKNPIKNYKTLLEKSTFAQNRFGEGHERDVKFAVQKNPEETLSGKGNMIDAVMFPIRTMDKGAVVPGMWAKYQSELKAGKSPEDAMLEAEALTERTQPSSSIESLSALQNGGSFLKIMTMFQNQTNKYFRIMGNNARNFKYGRGSRAKAALNIAMAWVVLPAMFQFIADAFRFDKEHQGRAFLLGPLNFMLIAGQVFQSAYGWTTGDKFGYQVSPVSDSVENILKGVGKVSDLTGDGYSTDDMIKMVEYFAKAGGELFGLPTPYAIQVEGALRSGDYRELVFSRWSLQSDDSQAKTMQKLVDAETKLGTEIDIPESEVPGVRRIAEFYGLNNFRSAVGSALRNTDFEDVTEANGFSPLSVAVIESYQSEAVFKTMPNVPLYQINSDQLEDYTFEDYYNQWQARKGITDPDKLKEFDELYPQAKLGNFSRRQLEQLKEYHYDTPEDEKALFLQENPEIDQDPADEWLRSNPEDNARLALFGQAKVLTEEAYNSLQGMMSDLDVPNNLVSGIPPRNIAPDYFGYQDLLSNFSASSSEALLYRLEHPEVNDWMKMTTPKNNINVLRINTTYRAEDAIYDEFNTGDITFSELARQREAYLIENPEYAEARTRRKGYEAKIPEEWIDTYVRYSQTGYTGNKRVAWLRNNYDFYLAVKDLLDWGPLRLSTSFGGGGGGGLPGLR